MSNLTKDKNMNHSVVLSEHVIARPGLPFEPTDSFFSSVARFAASSGVQHMASLDKFFEIDQDSAPGFFFHQVAFGKRTANQPEFFGSGFHFQDGERRFSFFAPAFEKCVALF